MTYPYIPKPKTEGTCQHCGKAFLGRADKRYCTPDCGYQALLARYVPRAHHDHVCHICGKSYTAVKGSMYCSPRCKQRASNIKQKERYPRKPYVTLNCKQCGKEFSTIQPRQIHCCHKCADYAACHNRRAKKRAAFVERIYFDVVNKRDKGICQICGSPVDPSAPHNSSKYPSIDHIIPLSKDGLHCYDNVQLAHYGCNSAKSNYLNYERKEINSANGA